MIQKFRKEDVWGLRLQFIYLWLFDRDPYNTVDGQIPAPPIMMIIPLFLGF